MCFTTCWQERVKKRGELFTSKSLKNIITSVRWEQLTRTGSKVFVVIVVVVCCDVWTALCFFACLGESAPASATGHVCVSVCEQEREEKPGPKRKHIPLVLAFSTCLGLWRCRLALTSCARSRSLAQTHKCSGLCTTRVHVCTDFLTAAPPLTQTKRNC